MALTLEEARGIAACIWTKPNYRRRVLDTQLCEDFANILVDEVAKATIDDKELAALRASHEALKGQYTTLQDVNNKLTEHSVEAQAEITKFKLDFANLQSENENLKLRKKDEVV